METEKITFDIPPQVAEILELLKAHTYKAYLVGSCVCSMLRGENPLDFDVAVNAEPARITAIFEEKYKTAAGSLPGELIIINGAMGISVSPFRGTDESGRPVCGVKSLTLNDDLRHRVYTADAIAYDPENGLYDPFDGISCVTDHRVILKAIGENEAESADQAKQKPRSDKKIIVKPPIPVLTENPAAALDAIRRFSRGGIGFSAYTARALCSSRHALLDAVPRDWLLDVLHDIVLGKKITDTLMIFRPILFTLIPKLTDTDGYSQRSAYQEYDLFEHTAKAVGYAVPDYTVRLALLLHGIGKKDCESDKGAYNSYDGHEERSAMLAREVLQNFSVSENIINEVVFLILHHDDDINEQNYPSFTAEYGAARVKSLLLFQSANLRAKNPDRSYEQRAAELRSLADGIERGNQTRSVTAADLKRLIEREQRGKPV